METVVGVKGSIPNLKPIWMPFYNFTPIFKVNSYQIQDIVNTGDTNKYAYTIDPMNDRGICVVSDAATNNNGKQQDSWILLPPLYFNDEDGDLITLPVGYTITVMNHIYNPTGNVYVTGNVDTKNACIIIDANRNQNKYCKLQGQQQCVDTYVYMGSYYTSEAGTNTMYWQSYHDTQ